MDIFILQLQLILTALATSLACLIPGTFLILRGTSLISDAISNAIFLGIVTTFIATQTLQTWPMFIGALATSLITVWCIEKIIATNRIYPDAVIGLMFPFVFALSVILINVYASNIHLDIDAVLLGELAFTPLYQIMYHNTPIGSYALWTMIAALCANILFLIMWYKKLLVTSFDTDFAQMIHYNPAKTYWFLMLCTCVTIFAAFETVGAILVIAFIIIPPATAQLITHTMKNLLIIAMLFAILGTLTGYLLAMVTATSIAGAISTMFGLQFLIVYTLQRVQQKNILLQG